MKPGMGRVKGASFERKIAGMIVKAFASRGITKKDCYRTPSSGGHRYAKETDPGDLVLSPELTKLFPFSIECKHYRKLDWHKLLTPGAKGHWDNWWKQCLKATPTGRYPMVVFQANRSIPFVMFNRDDGVVLGWGEPRGLFLQTAICGVRVIVVRFAHVLKLQEAKCSS